MSFETAFENVTPSGIGCTYHTSSSHVSVPITVKGGYARGEWEGGRKKKLESMQSLQLLGEEEEEEEEASAPHCPGMAYVSDALTGTCNASKSGLDTL